jgi:hypothetical protein
MAQSKKDVLTTLQAEVAFVERGGYRTPQQAAWRPQFVFEDSPTCLNFRNFGERRPCSQCALIDFVPKRHQEGQFPCRYIPLDDHAHTLDFLYRTATEKEAHAIVANWLRKTIAQLKYELAPEIFPEAGMSAACGKSEH